MSEPPATDLRSSKLPWVVAALALSAYLLTMNTWLTLESLSSVGKAGGWYWWVPNLSQPLTWLVLLPFKVLPAASRPLALNVFSAALAALSLLQLVRAVILLPQDRTREQRQRAQHPQGLLSLPGKWVPPVLAAGALGFQLTFWEHATAFTGEMLDLLLFSFIVRCILEHRLADHRKWLNVALLTYGFGIANNWAMIGFFPVFVATVVLLEKRKLFTKRRLLATIGLGSVGLLLYLLLPSLNHFSGATTETWTKMFRYQFVAQKAQLLGLPKYILVILSLTSFFPLLSLSIKWPTHGGDTNPLAQAFAGFTFHLIHGLFLVLCVWVCFDPFLSPREVGKGGTFLTLYWLSALCAGYYAGYFLVVCANLAGKQWQKPSPALKVVRGLVTTIVMAASLVAPGALAWINAPKIAERNTPSFHEFAKRLAGSLPEEPAVIFSAQPELLVLASAALAELRPDHQALFVDLRYLGDVNFHARMLRRSPSRWPADWLPEKFPHGIPAALPPAMILRLAREQNAWFLHPVDGESWLEWLHLEQHGLAFQLRQRSTTEIAEPAPTPEQAASARETWTPIQDALGALKLPADTNFTHASFISRHYSAGLTFHGAFLSETADATGARAAFEEALRILPDNLAAKINLAFPPVSPAGSKNDFDMAQWTKDVQESFGSWPALIIHSGPPIAPPALHARGVALLGSGLYRQAAILLMRARDIVPDNAAYRVTLAETFLRGSQPDLVLNEIAEIRKLSSSAALTEEQKTTLLRMEAMASYEKKDLEKAERLLKEGLASQPDSAELQRALSNLYILTENATNAVASLEAQLKLNPEDSHALLNLGGLRLKSGDAEAALAAFDRLIKNQPNYIAARINRVMAYMTLGRFADARRDLDRIESVNPNEMRIPFYRSQIDLQEGDPQSARTNLVAFLRLAPPGSAEAKAAAEALAKIDAEAKQ